MRFEMSTQVRPLKVHVALNEKQELLRCIDLKQSGQDFFACELRVSRFAGFSGLKSAFD